MKELLVISQDTSAYGVDIRHAETNGHRAHITDLARDLGSLGAWVRLHYVYPYPHVSELIPLMARGDGAALPRYPVPACGPRRVVGAWRALRRRRRRWKRIAEWRAICPDIALRSTFIVGYPGETEAEFQVLLDWLEEAQLDRVGCFKYENVAERALERSTGPQWPMRSKRSAGTGSWRRRSPSRRQSSRPRWAPPSRPLSTRWTTRPPPAAPPRDAPEIDGNLFIDEEFQHLAPGDMVTAVVEEAGDYDLWGRVKA